MTKTDSSPIRVLLADDHAVVRAGIRQYLELSGDIEVVGEASDGEEALVMFASLVPDVTVLDLQMPLLSGIDVTRRLRSTSPQAAILVLTAYDDDPFITAALKAGANGYVLKTASPEAIVQAVHEVNQGRPSLDPEVARKLIQQVAQPIGAAIVEPLSDREQEVLTLAGRGLTNKAIGIRLGISDRTVQNHLARIYEKLQAASRTEAVMRAVSLGWLPPSLGKIEDS